MTNGVNMGKCCGVNIIDYTHAFNLAAYLRYIEKALSYVQHVQLKGVENINIYDKSPENFPIVARGGYCAPTLEKGADLNIYLDQNLGHMLSLHKKRNKFTDVLDGIFVHTFGKLFIVDTLFHELGHHIYNATSTEIAKTDDKASEEYANEYAIEMYGKMYPLAQRHYGIINGLYHLIYWRRILKDNETKRIKYEGTGSA